MKYLTPALPNADAPLALPDIQTAPAVFTITVTDSRFYSLSDLREAGRLIAAFCDRAREAGYTVTTMMDDRTVSRTFVFKRAPFA